MNIFVDTASKKNKVKHPDLGTTTLDKNMVKRSLSRRNSHLGMRGLVKGVRQCGSVNNYLYLNAFLVNN